MSDPTIMIENVLNALAAGITIEEIHQSMGIARTTIDRIGKGSQS